MITILFFLSILAAFELGVWCGRRESRADQIDHTVSQFLDRDDSPDDSPHPK